MKGTKWMQEQLKTGGVFVRWVLYACLIGVTVGLAAVAFLVEIEWAGAVRAQLPWLIVLLPLAGVAIVLLYRGCGMEKDRGTDLVLMAVREAGPLRLRTAPLIFAATVLTHLCGGSAGREGAALQLGGSLAAWTGRKIGLDEKDERIMVMCGMAAAFSALFGTPLTAAVFAMEVVSVGVMYYAAMVPCLVSSLVGTLVARGCGLHSQVGYVVEEGVALGPVSMLQAAAMGLLCALTSILFCRVMHAAPGIYAKYLPNPMARAVVGGGLVLALTLLVGEQTYNGAGDEVIRELMGGETIPEAFLRKIVFTAP